MHARTQTTHWRLMNMERTFTDAAPGAKIGHVLLHTANAPAPFRTHPQHLSYACNCACDTLSGQIPASQLGPTPSDCTRLRRSSPHSPLQPRQKMHIDCATPRRAVTILGFSLAPIAQFECNFSALRACQAPKTGAKKSEKSALSGGAFRSGCGAVYVCFGERNQVLERAAPLLLRVALLRSARGPLNTCRCRSCEG